MTSFPLQNGKWTVAHGRNFFADLVRTRNIDLSRPGYITLAKKPVVLYTEDTDTDFGTVMAIVPLSTGTSTTYYLITTEHIFSWDATTSAFIELPTSSSPSTDFYSDGVIFNGVLHVSGGSNVVSYASGSWTQRIGSGLTSDYPHPLCVFENKNQLAVGIGNVVKTYNTSYSVQATLTIPAEYVITGLRWRQNNLYIATRALGGTSAKMFIWNGTGGEAQYASPVNADWIYSMTEYLSTIVVLTSRGQLLRFNGGGFDPLAALPIYYTPYSWSKNSALSNSTGRCANRGMISDGDRIYINIDGAINTSQTDACGRFLVDQPSGLWVYEESGLSHRAGYCTTRYNSTTYTFGSSSFVFSTAHNLQTGDMAYPTDVTGLAGITANQVYYVIVESTTSIKLARSKADALSGKYVTVTGSPSGSTVIIDTFDTLGATYTQTFPGAVSLYVTANPPTILGSNILFAGDVTKSDGTTSISSLMSLGPGHNIGSFITTPIPSSEVKDSFKSLFTFVENLWRSGDEVRIKYRYAPRYGFPTRYRQSDTGLATWVTNSSFTIDTTVKDFKGSVVGDEIEIIEGAGAGYTAHISTIEDSTNTFTVTIDESIPGITAGMKSEVIVDNWTLIPPAITKDSASMGDFFGESGFEKPYSIIQFKVELRGIDTAVRAIKSGSQPVKKLA